MGHAIVCGLGHVGYRVALLLARVGVPTRVVHTRASEEWVHDLEARGIECIAGDARDERSLRRAGLAEARAVVAVTDQDLTNLSAALDAKRLQPSVDAIVRLHDRGLARHVEEGLDVRQVLSTSALAAPAFVSAALGREDLGHFRASGSTWTLQDLTAGPPPAGATVLFSLDGEGRIVPGAGPGKRPALGIARAPASRRAQPRAGVAAAALDFLRRTPPAARLLLLGLLALVLAGTAVIQTAMGLGWVDALYFVVTTVTTVGYGDHNFLESPGWLKGVGCVLMLAGAALMAAFVGVVTEALLAYRLRDLLARRRRGLRDHVIVAGGGHVGARILEQLRREGQPAIALGEGAGAETEDGERTGLDAALGLAGIDCAKALVAVYDDDVRNLGLALQARHRNSGIRTVARVFDGVLAEKLQRELAVDAVLSVSSAAAPSFAAAVLHDGVRLACMWNGALVVVREERGSEGELGVAVDFALPEGGGESVRISVIALAPEAES